MAGGAHVLWVEDEPGLLETGKTFLEQEGGFRVDAVRSAHEALELLAGSRYDVIVSDYRMPQLDGIEFLRTVRGEGNTIPFILSCEPGHEDVVIEALNNGATFFLRKTRDPQVFYDELSHAIRQVVLKRQPMMTLAGQEQRHQDLRNTRDLILGIAPDGRILFANSKWLDTLGYRESGIAGLTLSGVAHEEGPARLEDILRRVLSGENAGIIDVVFMSRGGARVYTEGMLDLRVEGGAQYVRGIFRDVTGRKTAEAELRESENKFATVFRNSPVALTIVSAVDGTFIDINDTFVRNTGYSREEVIGNTADHLGIFAIRNQRKQMLATLREERGVQGMEVSFRTKSGEIRRCLFSSRYIRMGARPHILSMIEDITERKAAEEALKEREEKFRTIFEYSPYPIAINSLPDGKFIAVNAAFEKSSGYSESEVIGRGPVELKLLSFKDFGRLASHLLVSGKLRNIPLTLTGKNGDQVFVSFFTIPVAINNRPAIMTMAAETTSLKKAEKELLRINEELRGSEEKFRAIFENSAPGMSLVQPDLRFVAVNPSWASMFGYTQEEFGEMTVGDIMYPTDIAPDTEGIRLLGAGEHPYFKAEKRYVRKDGGMIWGALTVTAIRGQDGTLRHYFAQIEDITRKKLVQDSLKENEERYRSFMEKFRGIAYLTRPDWRPVFIHGAVEEITGYSPEDFERGALRWDHLIHPEDIAGLRKRGDTELFTTPGHFVRAEYRIFRKDGEIRWVSDLIQNMEDERGDLLLSGVLTDITEQKRMEEALRESEARYRGLLEGSPDLIFIIDRDDRVAFVNEAAAKFLGLPAEEITGRSRDSLFPPEIAERQKEAVAKVFETGEHFRSTGMFDYGEHRRWFDHYLVPLCDHSGNVTQVFGISRDMTSQKEVEEELRQANRKSNLLSRITRHDITNQLQILDGYAVLLQEMISDPTRAAYLTHLMKASGQIGDMIAIAREYELIGVHAPVWHNVREVVSTAWQGVIRELVELKNDIPGDLEVYADPLLGRVLGNLMDNALRHGGTITAIIFSFEDGGDHGIIVCQDDGTGVPGSEKERIFEAGVGAHSGFGLTISREILGITDITIRETGNAGSGARFELTVPVGGYRRRSG
ncbi:PAS domain S-box-containing protein [Methanolinea mesophila]|uniref:PAS domain S-box protein n=1 Tax=Methanolinea mesophila TaxID=547055 RepID=UPI001AEA1F66|nr:PAS domain S-box protein [Methanolinea mesophila]MBP1929939.1 PAS domain S-box-containing protein [Methanolinea mesophila]